MSQQTEFRDYVVRSVVDGPSATDTAAVISLWRDNDILPSAADPAERAKQVVCVCEHTTRGLVGVSTIYPVTLGEQEEPYYGYRMFIQPEDRYPGLMRIMTTLAYETLREVHDTHKPKGLIFYTENRKLMRPGMVARMERGGCRRLSHQFRGQDIWVWDF